MNKGSSLQAISRKDWYGFTIFASRVILTHGAELFLYFSLVTHTHTHGANNIKYSHIIWRACPNSAGVKQMISLWRAAFLWHYNQLRSIGTNTRSTRLPWNPFATRCASFWIHIYYSCVCNPGAESSLAGRPNPASDRLIT